MKRVHLFAAAAMLALVALIGCAGDGSSTPGTTGSVLTSEPRIEAVVVVSRSNLKDPNKYTDAQLRDPLLVDPNDLINPTLWGVQDPRNIQTGEAYWFQLVSYDAAGNRIIHDDNITWQTSDTTGTFGNLGANSGLFLAGEQVNQSPQYVFAFRGNTRYQVEYNVKPRQVRLIGVILDENNNPVPGVEIFFYDSFNTLVGAVTSAFDGTWRASLPTNTASFQVTVDSIPVEYYQTFSYDGLRYTPGAPQCKAPLPALEAGTRVLTQPVLLRVRVAGQETPPPTGCNL